MQKIIHKWCLRNVTIKGRIILENTILVLHFVYIFQSLMIPDDVLKRINTLFYKFIWAKKGIWKEIELKSKVTEKVCRNVIDNDFEYGGLNMINIFDMQLALSFKWIAKLQSEGKGIWRTIPTYYYNILGENLSVFNSNVK